MARPVCSEEPLSFVTCLEAVAPRSGSRHRNEGITLSKLVNLIVLGPAVVVALVSEPLQFAAAIPPTYWPVKAVVAGITGDPFWTLFLLGGLVVHLLGIAVLGRWFASRAD